MRISDWSSDVCSSDLFQRHAANRAVAGPDLLDFRMHRAGPDRPFRRVRYGPWSGARGAAVMMLVVLDRSGLIHGKHSTHHDQIMSDTLAGSRRPTGSESSRDTVC